MVGKMDETVLASQFADRIADKSGDAQARFEAVLTVLGSPYARAERFAIYNGDCVELLGQIPAQTLDLTFTSPPYNIGKEYEEIRPLEEYLEWCARWLEAIHRATRSDGAFMLNVGYVSIDGRAKAMKRTGFVGDRIR